MFIGHYAPAAILKPLSARTPLWHLFVAVQFLDYLWAIFILAGVEHGRVTPGFLEASALDLYDMPYTHSLAAAVLWSVLAGGIYRGFINRQAGALGALLIGLAVFSHWIADLIVHAPDLALYPGSAERLGLGLWSSVMMSQSLEIGAMALGLFLYASATAANGPTGRLSLLVVAGAAIALQVYNLIGPPPATIERVALSALGAYTLMAILAWWMDRTRSPRKR